MTQQVKDVASGSQSSAHTPLPTVKLAYLRGGCVDENKYRDLLILIPVVSCASLPGRSELCEIVTLLDL